MHATLHMHNTFIAYIHAYTYTYIYTYTYAWCMITYVYVLHVLISMLAVCSLCNHTQPGCNPL